MASLSYSDLNTLLNLSLNPSATIQESIIDQAIDLLNLYANQSISNLSGAAGSKTVTLTSKERGAVLDEARSVYYHYYLSQVPITGDGVTAHVSTIPEPIEMAKQLGLHLVTRTILRT